MLDGGGRKSDLFIVGIFDFSKKVLNAPPLKDALRFKKYRAKRENEGVDGAYPFVAMFS